MAGAGGGGAGGVVVRPGEGEGGQQQPAGRHGRDTLDIETEAGAGRGQGGQTVLSALHAVCHRVTWHMALRQIFARTLLSNHLLMVTSLPFKLKLKFNIQQSGK